MRMRIRIGKASRACLPVESNHDSELMRIRISIFVARLNIAAPKQSRLQRIVAPRLRSGCSQSLRSGLSGRSSTFNIQRNDCCFERGQINRGSRPCGSFSAILLDQIAILADSVTAQALSSADVAMLMASAEGQEVTITLSPQVNIPTYGQPRCFSPAAHSIRPQSS